MKNIILTAVILSSLITIGCHDSKKLTTGATGGSGSEVLYMGEWKLTEVQGNAVPDDSKATLMFLAGKENKVKGSTGCNRLNGSFELSGANAIKFQPLAVTRMACLNANANEIESKLINALTKVTNWGITNNGLLLKNGDSVVAKLVGVKQPTSEELELNGAWELNYISGTKIAFEGLFPNKKPLIIFDLPKSEITGNGGCNGYSAKIKVDGNKIIFGDALSTMMACEGNGEPVFFKTLKTITGYSINDNTLTMLMDDIAVMRFIKK